MLFEGAQYPAEQAPKIHWVQGCYDSYQRMALASASNRLRAFEQMGTRVGFLRPFQSVFVTRMCGIFKLVHASSNEHNVYSKMLAKTKRNTKDPACSKFETFNETFNEGKQVAIP